MKIPALLGRKVGMTRAIEPSGEVVPVTVVQAGPCVVLQVKTKESDGYFAVQLGFEDVKPHRSTMPLIGHAGKAGVGPKRACKEVRLDTAPEVTPGQVLSVDRFSEAEVKYLDVTGTSKGRGFTGVMKRYGFGGQPGSHGTERKHRSPGSIGGQADRLRGRCVRKGKRMAGQMGHARVTQRCLKLVAVDAERNLLLIRGSIPGPNGGLVFVRKSKTKG